MIKWSLIKMSVVSHRKLQVIKYLCLQVTSILLVVVSSPQIKELIHLNTHMQVQVQIMFTIIILMIQPP